MHSLHGKTGTMFYQKLSEYNRFKDEGKWLYMLSTIEPFRGKMSTSQVHKLMMRYEEVNPEGTSKVYDLFQTWLGFSREQIQDFWYQEEGQYL